MKNLNRYALALLSVLVVSGVSLKAAGRSVKKGASPSAAFWQQQSAAFNDALATRNWGAAEKVLNDLKAFNKKHGNVSAGREQAWQAKLNAARTRGIPARLAEGTSSLVSTPLTSPDSSISQEEPIGEALEDLNDLRVQLDVATKANDSAEDLATINKKIEAIEVWLNDQRETLTKKLVAGASGEQEKDIQAYIVAINKALDADEETENPEQEL